MYAIATKLGSNCFNSVDVIVRCYTKCKVIVCVCNYSPLTAVLCRTQLSSLLRVSILFRPHRNNDGGLNCCVWLLIKHGARKSFCRRPLFWWSRRALPPGPQRLFHDRFSVIAGKASTYNYSACMLEFQRFLAVPSN